MVLKNYYWIFPKAIHPMICNKIISYMKTKTISKACVNDESILDKKYRDSDVCFGSSKWLYKYIQPFVKRANQYAEWNFQWDGSEDVQLTAYGKKQHYHWHQDDFAKANRRGKKRKLSCVIALNNATEYKGGALQLSWKDKFKDVIDEPVYMKDMGSVIVFPSFVWHRVTNVTSGIRYSATSWHEGNAYV
jgi:PKHD-type hydroxylase